MARAATWILAVWCGAGCSFQGAGQSGGPGDEPDADITDSGDAGADGPDAPATGCVPLPEGALAWWDGEELGIDILGNHDASGIASSPTVSPGFVGNAMTLGNNDDIIFDAPPQGTTFTIEGWVFRAIDDTDWITIYGFNGDSGLFLFEHKTTYWDNSGGQGTGGNALIGDSEVTRDTWHHVAITYDGADLRVYIDGAPDGEAAAQDINLPVDEGRIGGVVFQDGQDFEGQIDELTVYDRALPAAAIAAIAAAAEEGKCKPGGDGDG